MDGSKVDGVPQGVVRARLLVGHRVPVDVALELHTRQGQSQLRPGLRRGAEERGGGGWEKHTGGVSARLLVGDWVPVGVALGLCTRQGQSQQGRRLKRGGCQKHSGVGTGSQS